MSNENNKVVKLCPPSKMPPLNKSSARLAVMALLEDEELFSEMEPYITNGGLSGGSRDMDLLRCVDLLRGADIKGTLLKFKLRDKQLGDVLLSALRSEGYRVVKKKIIGYNDKAKVLMVKDDEDGGEL